MILAALLTAAPAVLLFALVVLGVHPGEAALVRLARRRAPSRRTARTRRPRPVFLLFPKPLAGAVAGRAPPAVPLVLT